MCNAISYSVLLHCHWLGLYKDHPSGVNFLFKHHSMSSLLAASANAVLQVRLLVKLVGNCCTAWAQVTAAKRMARRGLLARAFGSWWLTAGQHQELSQRALQWQQQQQLKLCWKGFQGWRQLVLWKKQWRAEGQLMAAAYHQSRVLARAWQGWRHRLPVLLQQEQEVWETAELFRWQSLARKAFVAWRGFAQRSAPLRRELADLLLEKVFKVVRGEEPQPWRQQQQLLQDSWLAWQSTMQLPLPPSDSIQQLRYSAAGVSSSREGSLGGSQPWGLIGSMGYGRFSHGGLPIAGGWWRETPQYSVLLHCFEQWCGWAQRKAQQRKVLVLVEQHRRVSVCFKVLMYWQQVSARAAAVAQKQQAKKEVMLTELLQVTQQRARVREFVLQWRVGLGFRGWVEMVRFKAAAAQGFWCYNLQHMCFAGWAGNCTAAGQLLLSTKQQQRQQGGAQVLPWQETQQQQQFEQEPNQGEQPQRQHVDDQQQEQEDGETLQGVQARTLDMERARSAVGHWLEASPHSKSTSNLQQPPNGGILGLVAAGQQEKDHVWKHREQLGHQQGQRPQQQQQAKGHDIINEMDFQAIKAPATPLLGDGGKGVQCGFRRSSSSRELYCGVVRVEGNGVGHAQSLVEPADGAAADVDLLEPYLAILRE